MAYELRDFSDVAPATTIGSDITNVSTTITVASGTGYPSGGAAGDFIVQIESELVRCSARAGATLTVSGGVAGRGINGTTAVAHVTGVTVNHVHTATNDSKEANYAVSKTVGKVTTSQDLLVADAVNSFTRLGIGANGTILQALAGAVAYGALPANSVGASQITDGTVGSAELAAASVIAGKIGVGGVSAANQFAAGVVDGTAVAAAIKDAAAGTASLRTLSTTGTTACAGNDARLSDVRTPAAVSITQAMFTAGYRAAFKGTSAPASPVQGDLWVDTTVTTGRTALKIYDGSTWVYAAGGPQPLYAARMYRSAAYANLAAAPTTLTLPFDAVDYDYSSALTTGAAAHYTVPITGLCQVNAAHSVNLNNNPEGLLLQIFKGGVAIRNGTGLTIRGGSSADGLNFTAFALIACTAGDLLDIRIVHNPGTNACAQTSGTSNSFAEFNMVA